MRMTVRMRLVVRAHGEPSLNASGEHDATHDDHREACDRREDRIEALRWNHATGEEDDPGQREHPDGVRRRDDAPEHHRVPPAAAGADEIGRHDRLAVARAERMARSGRRSQHDAECGERRRQVGEINPGDDRGSADRFRRAASADGGRVDRRVPGEWGTTRPGHHRHGTLVERPGQQILGVGGQSVGNVDAGLRVVDRDTVATHHDLAPPDPLGGRAVREGDHRAGTQGCRQRGGQLAHQAQRVEAAASRAEMEPRRGEPQPKWCIVDRQRRGQGSGLRSAFPSTPQARRRKRGRPHRCRAGRSRSAWESLPCR